MLAFSKNVFMVSVRTWPPPKKLRILSMGYNYINKMFWYQIILVPLFSTRKRIMRYKLCYIATYTVWTLYNNIFWHLWGVGYSLKGKISNRNKGDSKMQNSFAGFSPCRREADQSLQLFLSEDTWCIWEICSICSLHVSGEYQEKRQINQTLFSMSFVFRISSC